MSLIHYWPLNELSGATISDTVGDMNGTVAGDSLDATVVAAPGDFIRGRDLQLGDGSGGTPSSADLRLFSGTPDLTYSLSQWSVVLRVMADGTRPDLGTSPGTTLIFADGDNDNNYIGWWTDRDGDLYEIWVRNSSGTWFGGELYPKPVLWSGAWRTLAITCDGTTVRFYIDATELVNYTCDAVLKPKGGFTAVGAYYTSSWQTDDAYFATDDIGIFNSALSAADLAELQGAPLGDWPGSAPPPVFNPGPLSVRRSYLDIDDGVLPSVRIPISSWQATTQSGQSSFAQAVIPSALSWVDAISDRLTTGEMIITHEVEDIDGSTLQWEVLRAPIQQFFLDRGHLNATARVSSYYTVLAADATTVKTLRNIRSLSTSSAGLRVRCEFDPTIKPGDTVDANGTEFTVAYINAYENNSDSYMDVGERAV